MKKLSIFFLALVALFSVSCNKTVITNNVVSSTVMVYSNDWYWDNNSSWRVDIDYNAINANVDDYGAVLVYMDYAGTWRQIPLTQYYYDEQNDVYCSKTYEVSSYYQGVSIFCIENDFYHGACPGTVRFKIVVIPAAVYSSRSDVNYEDYNAVKAAFQLAD